MTAIDNQYLGLIVVGLVCTAIGHATGNTTVSAIGTAAAVAGLVYSGIGLVAGALGSTVATGDLIMLTPSVVYDNLSCAGFAYDAAKSYNLKFP